MLITFIIFGSAILFIILLLALIHGASDNDRIAEKEFEEFKKKKEQRTNKEKGQEYDL